MNKTLPTVVAFLSHRINKLKMYYCIFSKFESMAVFWSLHQT